jgi:uncharacterized protein (TIGR02246 family)
MNAPLLGASVGRQYVRNAKLPAVMVAVGVFLAWAPSPAVGQTAGDSVGVSALVEAYRTTWGEHDASALARFFTADADMIMGTDPVSVGREAVEEWWRAYFERQEPERQVEIDLHAVRLITPDVAVLNVTTTTGGRSGQGKELQSRRARGTWVVVHQAGGWHISAMRGMPTEQDKIIRESARRE